VTIVGLWQKKVGVIVLQRSCSWCVLSTESSCIRQAAVFSLFLP
jgi:hypothetical protein